MFEEVRTFLKSITDKKKRFGLDILELCQLEGKKIAFHSSCTDGIISAVLLKSIINDGIFVPLDYWILKQTITRNFLSYINWYAILDLEPFHKHISELFVDHHISTVNKPIMSRKIHFETDVGGPSAAFVLLNSINNIKNISEHIIQLVNISVVTDTADYKINAPYIQINKKDIENNFDNEVWFLEDACKSCETVNQNLEIIEILSEEGINGLFRSKIVNRINSYRKKRKYYMDYGLRLQRSEVIILLNPPDTTAQDSIVHTLLNYPETKITFSLIETQSGVKISMRRSKLFERTNPTFANKIRLDKLAEKLDGGGHPAAAGAKSKNIDEAINKITNWAKDYSFNIKTINVGSELKKYE